MGDYTDVGFMGLCSGIPFLTVTDKPHFLYVRLLKNCLLIVITITTGYVDHYT